MFYPFLKLIIMKSNMSRNDRIIRIIVAAIAIILYYSGIITGVVGIIAIALSAIFLLTSFINFCPLYSLFGISTRPAKSQS